MAPALGPEHDFLDGTDEVVLRKLFPVLSRGKNGSLVHEVRKVGTGESWGALGYNGKYYIGAKRLLARVYLQDILPVFSIGKVNHDTPVETARTDERRVENIGTVCRRHDDDLFILFETVHLDEYLVQGLLAFVVATADARAAHASDSVYLIYEKNGGRSLFRHLERISYARSADADEHFHEFRAGDGEERHVAFAGDRSREKRLPCSCRTHEKNAFRYARTDLDEFFRILEKIDYLGKFHFRLFCPRDIRERDFLHLVFRIHEARH